MMTRGLCCSNLLMRVVRLFIFVTCVNIVFIHIVPSGFEYLALSRVIPIFVNILYCNALRGILFGFSARTIFATLTPLLGYYYVRNH